MLHLVQDSGFLAVFKVTARDQGHYKGPSGAFVTYCNISCFNIIFKYHKWAGEYIYSRTVHLTVTYNFNAYSKQVSMSVTLTSKQQQ